MRICFISLGTFTHIGPYLDYFRQTGHDVHFIAMSPSPERGVPTYNVGLGHRYSETKGKWKYLISMLRARRLIKELKPDIVHAHYVTSCGLTAMVCGFHPTIVTVHGSDLTTGTRSRIWRPLLRRIFAFADSVNTVSKELEEMALSLSTDPAKIETLTLGIDTDKFALADRREVHSSRPLRLVCTRRLEKVFDHSTIIGALVLLKERGIDFHMTFVGDGSLRDTLKRHVEDVGLGDYIDFTGKVHNDDLPEILGQHEVYLSASLWDGMSLSLLEAMAMGLFPIVSDIKANAALLGNNVDGMLHKVGDANDLAKCIMQLHECRQLVTSAAQRNRQKVIASADRKTNMKRLERIFEELVKTR
ncbi:MAG: glycosyltransferase family 4 protein [Sedimentisphaerales bacterium]|jgi:glycosyltransferase involved in cell wall biosynthesis